MPQLSLHKDEYDYKLNEHSYSSNNSNTLKRNDYKRLKKVSTVLFKLPIILLHLLQKRIPMEVVINSRNYFTGKKREVYYRVYLEGVYSRVTSYHEMT